MKHKFKRLSELAVVILLATSSFCAAASPIRAGTNSLLEMERFTALEPIGELTPQRSEDIAASRWGLQFNKYDLPQKHIDMFLERMAESGVKWARVETRGYATESRGFKQLGYYRWDELDRIVDGLSRREIEMFICINAAPFEGLDDSDSPLRPEVLHEWLGHVRALTRRYHDRVHYWEVLNEPSINANYAKVLKGASKAIKEIDAQAKILGGSLVRVNVEGLRRLLGEFQVGPFIDGITFHPYSEFPESAKYVFEIPVETGYKPASALISDMRNLLEGQDHPVELWQGECGYPSSEHTTSWKGRGPWGENIQAKWLLRRFLTDFSLDIPVTVYFLLREPQEENRVNAKGLLRYGTWQPKPAYLALQHLASIFDERLGKPRKTQAVWEFEDEGSFNGIRGENLDRDDAPFSGAKAPYPIQIIGLTGSVGNAVVYYAPWRMQEYVKPAKVNVRIKNTSVIDPVLVDLLTGTVYSLQTQGQGRDLVIRGIPLADYPMAVIPRRIVPMN
jgi:hypothetical protein